MLCIYQTMVGTELEYIVLVYNVELLGKTKILLIKLKLRLILFLLFSYLYCTKYVFLSNKKQHYIMLFFLYKFYLIEFPVFIT